LLRAVSIAFSRYETHVYIPTVWLIVMLTSPTKTAEGLFKHRRSKVLLLYTGFSQGNGLKTLDICQCPAKISGNIHLGNISLYIIKYWT